ncbi:hypothetical protein [Streptomyces sp. bgisy027]|uniref:hypothetical protein n=1 Tax=unclassified Streptomyces TaxID=2593676 RepID=UPI003D7031C0
MADYTQPDVVPKRVRFFDGQYLVDQDFIDEQRFHLDRERRQSRLLRLTGISAGLTVAPETSDGESLLKVTAGMAVDSLGRHLVLASDTTVSLQDFDGRQDIEVHLAYREAATDVAQTDGVASERRWDESPRIVVLAPDGTTAVAPDDASPDLDDVPTVLLARVAVAESGDEVTVDLTAAQHLTLSVAGALGVGTDAPVSDLEIGDYGPKDRHLTFKVAGGDGHRSGLRLWAGSQSEHEGYSLEYDRRPSRGQGLHVRTHGSGDPDGGTTRLFVAPGGDVGIGTTAPDNSGGWDRVVDVVGTGRTRLSVRTANIEGHVSAHEGGAFGAAPGMAVGTASASPLTLVTAGAARLSVTADGHVGIGATTLVGTEGWGRVVDVVGTGLTKLSVRTAKVDARVMAHDTGMFGAAAGMIVGTGTNSPLTFVTNQAHRLTIGTDGDISLGSGPFTARWTTKHVDTDDPAEPHLRLHRDDTASGGKRLFLELFQGHGNPLQADVHPSIRFHHSSRYWHRIEGQPDGLHIKTGNMSADAHHDLWAGGVHAESLTIGSVTVGQAELDVLKRLAAGELNVEVFSTRLQQYAYASDLKAGTDTHHVLSRPNPAGTYRRWVLKPLASA